ncbi:MAG TPA: homoserine O-acetyltransferase [Arenimonas sp.]|nr:homoserine O-acetyltransferase [Arenimonas sp.]
MSVFISPGTAFAPLPSPFTFKRGGEILQGRMAYETWGRLNDRRNNAVLILTGLSPSAHAASNQGNPDKGWWEAMLGPDKAINTDDWFVICVNTLGSCKGSTGPATINPATQAPYALQFPDLSIEDCAKAAKAVLNHLQIESLACLIGNSMGGMVALAFLQQFPLFVKSHINVSGSAQALPFSIAIRSLQREAIRLDPQWNNGQYEGHGYPRNGMRIARKLGVVTYRSAIEWDGRFGRVRLENELQPKERFGMEFEVESYLEAHAERFVDQFDPNCYLYLSRAMDWFDFCQYCSKSTDDVVEAISTIQLEKALVLGAGTDILFPLHQQEQIALGLSRGGAKAEFAALDSHQGHDAFLVDIEQFAPPIRNFLKELKS